MTEETRFDLIDVAILLLASLLLFAIGFCFAGVCNAARAPRNVGQVMVGPPPIWPPPGDSWLTANDAFTYRAGQVADAAQPTKAGCTVPPVKGHGMSLKKCMVLEDKSVACLYNISARFKGVDGVNLGLWSGLFGVRRKSCKAPFLPEMVEMVTSVSGPEDKDPGTET